MLGGDGYEYSGALEIIKKSASLISSISAYYKDIQNKIVTVDVSVKGYSLQGNSNFVNEFKKE